MNRVRQLFDQSRSDNDMKWEDYELDYIKLHWQELTDMQLAMNLKRSIGAVKNQRHVLSLSRRRISYAWENRHLLSRLRQAVKINRKVSKMKVLIDIYEYEPSLYKREIIKEKLKKLSGL